MPLYDASRKGKQNDKIRSAKQIGSCLEPGINEKCTSTGHMGNCRYGLEFPDLYVSDVQLHFCVQTRQSRQLKDRLIW